MSDDYETHELELAFQAGAASRDTEIERLHTQINTLREVLEKACIRIEEYGFEIGEHWKIGRETLNATKDQP